jgi:hypothetical protein
MDTAGQLDAMGYPFTTWLLARRAPDGRAMRDAHGHQLFETHAEHLARQAAPTNQPAIGQNLDLFA